MRAKADHTFPHSSFTPPESTAEDPPLLPHGDGSVFDQKETGRRHPLTARARAEDTARVNSSWGRRWLPLLVPAGLALVLRTVGAALRPPWHDEYFTAWAARLGYGDLLEALRLDSGPPLLYVLTRLGALGGIQPLAMARAIAVLSGAIAVGLVAATAQRRWGERAAWTAGLLLACHPLALHWGCEGRAYGLLLVATAWAWYELTRLEEQSTAVWRLGAAVALACWSHSLGLILAVTLVAVCLLSVPNARRRALLAIGAGLASHLPWLPVMVAQPPAAIAWMAGLWDGLSIPRSTALALVRYLSPVAAAGEVLDLVSPPLVIELVGALLLLSMLVLAGRKGSRLVPPLAATLLPALALGLLVAAGLPVLFPGRAQVLFLTPFLVVLAAADERPGRAMGSALAVSGLALCAVSIAAWSKLPPSPEALLARKVRSGLPTGGTVVVGGTWRLGLDFHLGTQAPGIDLINYPASAGRHPGWYVVGHDRPGPTEAELLVATLAPTATATAILVATGAETAPDLRRIAARLGLHSVAAFPGGELFLWPGRLPDHSEDPGTQPHPPAGSAVKR